MKYSHPPCRQSAPVVRFQPSDQDLRTDRPGKKASTTAGALNERLDARHGPRSSRAACAARRRYPNDSSCSLWRRFDACAALNRLRHSSLRRKRSSLVLIIATLRYTYVHTKEGDGPLLLAQAGANIMHRAAPEQTVRLRSGGHLMPAMASMGTKKAVMLNVRQGHKATSFHDVRAKKEPPEGSSWKANVRKQNIKRSCSPFAWLSAVNRRRQFGELLEKR